MQHTPERDGCFQCDIELLNALRSGHVDDMDFCEQGTQHQIATDRFAELRIGTGVCLISVMHSCQIQKAIDPVGTTFRAPIKNHSDQPIVTEQMSLSRNFEKW